MNILRTILIGLSSFIFILAVTGFVYLLTLQTTIMDRAVVKNWLSESQLYDGRLINTLIQTSATSNGQPAGALTASPEAVKAALNTTFTSEFTKSQVESVVDSAYEWIDGSSPEFTFSIPIDQKRDTLIAELTKTIEPQIAALPVCQGEQLAQGSVCRPPYTSVTQLANELTVQSVDQSGAFVEPLTNESFASAAQTTSQPSGPTDASQLPAIAEAVNILLKVLPAAAIVSLAIILLATVHGQRITRTARLFRRVFFGMLFIFLPTVILVWILKDIDLGKTGLVAAQAGDLIAPLVKTIATGILSQLALISGIAGGVSAIVWITLHFIHHKTIPTQPTITPVATPVPYQKPSPTEIQNPTPENPDRFA